MGSVKRSLNLWGRITVFLIVLLGMVGLCVNTAMALDGSGTQEDPWRIRSLADFNDFAADANYWDDYTRLQTDVNLAGRVYDRAVIAPDVNDANNFFQGTAFTGAFDGNGHNIINLTIDGGFSNDYLGLFGYIDDAEVKNLGLEGGSVSGGSHVGGLVGENGSGSISNCYSTGDVEGVHVVVGGLVGCNWFGSVSNCYSTGDVSGGDWVGGLVGVNVGSVSNSYSIGDVSGGDLVGGLVGANGGSVSNCYSTGDVEGVHVVVGGLVGLNGGSVSDCLWDTETSNEPNMCGNEGTYCDPNYGKTTAEMHQQSTFTDWDFINVWNIGGNQTYPYLRTVPAGDINKDGIVNFLDVAILGQKWCEEE